jgi:subtilisin family serine protease
MWAAGYTGGGQVVAVLDTGVDSAHPFLTGKVVEEACYSDDSNCPNGLTTQTGVGSGVNCTYAASGCRHGTHVAGIAAGQGSDFSGVARGADIMSVQVFSRFTGTDCNEAGEDPCALSYRSDQIAGLERVYALRGTHDFSSVNMSLGSGQFFSNCDTDSRKAIIDNLRSAGIATVIASGNNNYTDSMSAPACISSAISVGNTTKEDTIYSNPPTGSNSASFLSLLAPGTSINSSVPGGGFAVFTGTSMAAPHVAGAWALLKEQTPTASVNSLLSSLQSTGTQVTDTRVVGGVTKPRINIADAAGVPIQRPANDNFANAQFISGANATLNGTNVRATRESGEPDHLPAISGSLGEHTVWYNWTAPSSGQVNLDTCTSSFDTTLAVYTGSALSTGPGWQRRRLLRYTQRRGKQAIVQRYSGHNLPDRGRRVLLLQ